MKLKTLSALLLTSLAIHSAAALANDTKFIAVNLTVMENKQIHTKAMVTTTDGQTAPYMQTRSTPYRSSAYRKGDGKAVIGMDTVETGVVAFFTPEIQSNGDIKTKVVLDISELESMKTTTSPDGLTLDSPSTRNLHLEDVLTLQPGKAITKEMGKYSVSISAVKQ